MFRMCGAIYKDAQIVRDCVAYQTDHSMSRTDMVLVSLKEICEYLDLAVPIWFDKNIKEFQRANATFFRQDNFVETIPFDSLRIEIIEE